MVFYIKALRRIVKAWPGEKYFKEYRFLPIFFFGGAALEYLMIHWHAGPGQVNFYKTFKRRKVDELVRQREAQSYLVTVKMPAGVTWPRYISFFIAATVASLSGAQIVHNHYKPLGDIEDLVQQELERRRKAREINSAQTSQSASVT